MSSIRLLAKISRCACHNSIKNGFKINNHKSRTLLSGQILQRIPSHPAIVSCSSNIIKTEEQKASVETEAFREISFLRKIKHAFGFDRDLSVPYKVLELSAYRSWMSIVQLVDLREFCEALDLPDTFNTWCLVNELHVWMVLTRLSFEGVEGRYYRNVFVTMMWKDVEMRLREVQAVPFIERKKYLEFLKFHLYNAILFYDEGLLSDDRALTNALWNMLFEQADVSATAMEAIVKYVRTQIYYLDKMDSMKLLSVGCIPFQTLSGQKLQGERKEILTNIYDINLAPK